MPYSENPYERNLMIFKSSTHHAEELAELLQQTADIVRANPSRVEWKELQKMARYFWQGCLIGRFLAHRER